MNMTPIELFSQWYRDEISVTKVKIPSACCLSTIGLDGFPNARFVSFKGVKNDYLIVTGPVTSRKGIEIKTNKKVALTFWWTETERQVRIQGIASSISEQLADKFFQERNRESQIVSIISNQGQELQHIEELVERYKEIEIQFSGKTLRRPENWGGYYIEPVRIEFLDFQSTRFHDRQLYEKSSGQWTVKQIQP
jgi:pyridoxamine 5'-phosphate oxidase